MNKPAYERFCHSVHIYFLEEGERNSLKSQESQDPPFDERMQTDISRNKDGTKQKQRYLKS